MKQETVTIFLSWSGATSKSLAEILCDWLPQVVPGLQPWMSSKDIDKGARWGSALSSKLESCDHGLLCILPDNYLEPWLLFEAGAISKSVDKGGVTPFLLGVQPDDLPGPLAQFQATLFERPDVLSMIERLQDLTGTIEDKDVLRARFRTCWPSFEEKVNQIPLPAARPGPTPKSETVASAKPVAAAEIIVLQVLTDEVETGIDVDHIVERTQFSRVRVEHLLDRLGQQMIIEAHEYYLGTTYLLTSKGRAFLIENSLVE